MGQTVSIKQLPVTTTPTTTTKGHAAAATTITTTTTTTWELLKPDSITITKPSFILITCHANNITYEI